MDAPEVVVRFRTTTSGAPTFTTSLLVYPPWTGTGNPTHTYGRIRPYTGLTMLDTHPFLVVPWIQGLGVDAPKLVDAIPHRLVWVHPLSAPRFGNTHFEPFRSIPHKPMIAYHYHGPSNPISIYTLLPVPVQGWIHLLRTYAPK